MRTRAAEVERVEALLELAGVESVSLADAADAPLLEPDPGSTPLWPEVEVRALFGAPSDTPGIAKWLAETLGEAAEVRVEKAPAIAAARPFSTQPVGERLLIVPADGDADAEADAEAHGAGRITLRLHMGLAFGTGEHPTTRMCLEWLERELDAGTRVLDYGCGSGVLAIAALVLGAAEARAVDIEPQALESTTSNAALNGVAGRIRVSRPDEIPDAPFDLVVANILSLPLMGLAGTFSRLLKPRGRVVMTGILDAQADGVISAYETEFDDIERSTSEGWSLVTARLRDSATETGPPRRD